MTTHYCSRHGARGPVALLTLAVLGLTASLCPPNAVYPQSPIDGANNEGEDGGVQAQDADKTPRLEEQLSRLAAGQRRIRGQLKRLETKLSDLRASAAQFSRVVVRIRTPDGKPIPGYEVGMISRANDEMRARATGKSGEQGVALDRFMPYGSYRLSLSGPRGWSAYQSVLYVEVGRPMELEVVAPDPAERGELILQNQLQAESFSDLPFGKIREPLRLRGYSIQWTPEPGADELREASFPHLGHGIERVAVKVGFRLTREIPQPGREPLEWEWQWATSGKERGGELLLLGDGVAMVGDIDTASVRPKPGGGFFSDLGDDEKVACNTFARLESLPGKPSFDVPPGTVQVRVDGIYGEATAAVRQSLQLDGDDGGPLWLNVHLLPDSQWPDRLFALENWQRSESRGSILTRAVSIEAGESRTVTLASP